MAEHARRCRRVAAPPALTEGLEGRVLLAYAPAGPEFRIDAVAGGHRYAPDVASDAAGNVVAVWSAEPEGGGAFQIMARRYDAAGNALGEALRVNQASTGWLYPINLGDYPRPAVAVDPDGRFVVAWERLRPESSMTDLYARRFDATGTALGEEVRVSEAAARGGEHPLPMAPDVAVGGDGRVLFAWGGNDPARPEDGDDIFARLYGADGSPLGGEFLVNSSVHYRQSNPAIAAGADGSFLIAWDGGHDVAGSGSVRSDVFGKRFDGAGAPLGGEVVISGTAQGHQSSPAVAADAAGNMTVAWDSDNGFGNLVLSRRIDAAGVLDPDFLYVAAVAYGSHLAVAPDGRAVVSYVTVDSQAYQPFAQWFTADGRALGERQRLHEPPGTASDAAAAMGPDGTTFFAWARSSYTFGDEGVWGRAFYDNHPPAASGTIAPVNVDEDAPPTSIDLRGAFSDADAIDASLTYAVTGVTNLSLFKSVQVEPAGTLRLDYARDAFGTATITVRATDRGGEQAETNFDVAVAPVNDAPSIGGLSDRPDPVTAGADLTLTATGITDVDNADLAGMTVAFYRESNGQTGLQTGEGGDTTLGTSLVAPFVVTVPTTGLATGGSLYYAQATDVAGGAGPTRSTENTVIADAPGAPVVTGFFVSLNQQLGPREYPVPGGPGQLRPLPWAYLGTQFRVSFNEPVKVDRDDLVVRDTRNTDYMRFISFSYDPRSYTAAWQLGSMDGISSDRWLFELSAGAPGGITDLAGKPLDGEWDDGADAYPSGDGVAGGDFHFRLNRLVADATGDGRVNSLDLADVKRRLNRTTADPGTGSGAYSPFADLDGSGRINSADLALVRRFLNARLPEAAPLSPSGAVASTPTSSAAGELLRRETPLL